MFSVVDEEAGYRRGELGKSHLRLDRFDNDRPMEGDCHSASGDAERDESALKKLAESVQDSLLRRSVNLASQPRALALGYGVTEPDPGFPRPYRRFALS